MTTVVQTVLLPQAHKLMVRVEVDRARRLLRIWFADGAVAVVSAREIERAGRPVTLDLSTVRLSDPSVILIDNTDGETEEVPWDFIRHHCDAEFAHSERDKERLSRKALGARVRAYRERAGLSQEELARRAKIGRITLSRIENGKLYAHTRTLEKIAAALGIHLADLIAGSLGSPSRRLNGLGRRARAGAAGKA
ncbi:MAG: helix-turn-helix domain-containing protein [Candidatus Bipolaricaulota bacterium]|nr:helix-turn-helix domain-containing protein [Candidatus Bipolaricaulota bacterium]MDW8140926.1 helix-turn-helix transcriptional regulator [Candidatus Bipolaricaulota bacterium]